MGQGRQRGELLRAGAAALIACVAPMPAQAASLAGVYLCAAGCRVTDAAPTVAIEGVIARCTNELGGLFIGAALADGSVSCFDAIGVASADGRTLRWSNGVVWPRRAP